MSSLQKSILQTQDMEGYFDIILRIHSGNTSPPCSAPGASCGHCSPSLPPTAPQNHCLVPFIFNMPSMALFSPSIFAWCSHGNSYLHLQVKGPGREMSRACRKITEILVFPSPIPKLRSQAGQHLSPAREKTECSQAKIHFASYNSANTILLYFMFLIIKVIYHHYRKCERQRKM